MRTCAVVFVLALNAAACSQPGLDGTGGSNPRGTGGAGGRAGAGGGGAVGTGGSVGTGGAAGIGGSGGGTGGGDVTGTGGATGGTGGTDHGSGGAGGRGTGGGGGTGIGGTTGTGGVGGGGARGAMWFTDWPAGSSPKEVAKRLIANYLARTLSTTGPLHYAEACTWFGSLTSAKLMGETTLDMSLITRFAPALQPNSPIVPTKAHVDDRVFGIVPLEIYLHNMGPDYLAQGKRLADAQWMSTTPDGITTEARYWIDDMWMIPALQVQAYRATKDMKYLDRTALTMASYLDRLQQPTGLFFHTKQSPQYWGRGNGWFAAGMAELLLELPATHPKRGRIVEGFNKMMAALLKYQITSGTGAGIWRQLIDHPEAWPETSGSAMFAYAMIVGVKMGILDEATYGPAARKAWLTLVTYLDANANLKEICIGTGEAFTTVGASADAQVKYYLDRGRNTGDFHGQAPFLWSATALLR